MIISILIPFYGNADPTLLDRCLHSIKNQKLDPTRYEIIVVDGDSLGNARNKGIHQAKGDYLFFIDADDYLFENTLSPLTDALQANRPDILSFGWKKVRGEKTMKPSPIAWKEYASGADYLISHNTSGSVWRYIFRKEFILCHSLFFTEGTYHEDEAFIAKALFHAAKFVSTEAFVYAYYQHPGSIMSLDNPAACMKHITDFWNLLIELRDYLQDAKASHRQQKALQRRIHFLTIDYLRQMVRYKMTFSYIRKSIKKLKAEGYLPLPNRKYSLKYACARLVINLL